MKKLRVKVKQRVIKIRLEDLNHLIDELEEMKLEDTSHFELWKWVMKSGEVLREVAGRKVV